jgi:hypothetical protein
MCLWVGGGIELELAIKAWAHKRISPIGFPKHLLESIWTKSPFPYSQWPPFEGAKQDTIGVIAGANAKLPYQRGPMPTYLMENKMLLVHHVESGRDAIV